MELELKTRAIAGQKIVNVKNYGALGNGIKDDTTAINNAIKACYDAGGGTVEVPDGRYLVDMVRQVLMKSRVHFKMGAQTELVGKPNGEPRYGMISMKGVTDAMITGGLLTGDRAKHNYSASGTHEWGHAIQFYGSQRVSIWGTVMTGFTGDGMSLGRSGTVRCDDVQIIQVLSTRNRRQGLSIVSADNVLVYDSAFTYIGDQMDGESDGTAPMCGIDIEPEKAAGPCSNILIAKCRMLYCRRYGFLLERRSDANGGNDVFDVELAECEIGNNMSNGMQNKGGTRLKMHDCDVHDNSASGSLWTGDRDSQVYNNKFGRNYTRNGVKVQNPPFTLSGTNSKTARDILKQSGSNVALTNNYFY